jgi:hypothetical protein
MRKAYGKGKGKGKIVVYSGHARIDITSYSPAAKHGSIEVPHFQLEKVKSPYGGFVAVNPDTFDLSLQEVLNAARDRRNKNAPSWKALSHKLKGWIQNRVDKPSSTPFIDTAARPLNGQDASIWTAKWANAKLKLRPC